MRARWKIDEVEREKVRLFLVVVCVGGILRERSFYKKFYMLKLKKKRRYLAFV